MSIVQDQNASAASTASVLDGFGSIGLAELVERAPLLHRLDRKYVLPVRDLPTLLAGLVGPNAVRVLEIDGRRQFDYRSGYFDTPDLDSYRAAAHRRRRRFKLRIRTYLDSDLRFLEVKIRGTRGTTVKERISYAGADTELGAEARGFVDAVLAGAGIRSEQHRFEPVLTTRYRRTTLFLPAGSSRVTIDTGLSWELPGALAVGPLDLVVVETKSQRSVSPVDRLLWSMKYRPCSLSKYATGLAALRPELPSNRWTPLLRRHFHTLTEARPE